jgi:pyruvate/2-oxoglutarate dehydrogenase complex dihydrolipoamide acyltransferase (E2) component
MSFSDIELAIVQYAVKAKNNQITLEELEGGTFTITNGGVYGSLLVDSDRESSSERRAWDAWHL